MTTFAFACGRDQLFLGGALETSTGDDPGDVIPPGDDDDDDVGDDDDWDDDDDDDDDWDDDDDDDDDDDWDDDDDDDDDDDWDDDDDDDDDDVEPNLECPEDKLPDQVPTQVFGTTINMGNSFDPPCVEELQPGTLDVTYLFVAPESGHYRFDTRNSNFDTVLYALEESCSPISLACNDDADDSLTSAIELDLFGGQVVTIVVDGYSAEDYGPYALNVEFESDDTCVDLSSLVPQSVEGSNVGTGNAWSGACGGDGEDVAYTWTAPADGFYAFDTFGSAFDTVLTIFDGDCGGEPLSCNDDAGGYFASSAAILANEGQTVTVVVDGKRPAETGAFTLNLTSAMCPERDLGSESPLSAIDTTVGASDVLSGSCAEQPAPGHLYGWTAPEAGVYRIDTFGSKIETVLFVRDGDCSGPELGCAITEWDEEGVEWGSRLELELAVGQPIVIGVESYYTDWVGPFRLNIERLR